MRLWVARQEWDKVCRRIPVDVLCEVAERQPGDPRERHEMRTCPTGGHRAWFVVREEENPDQTNEDPENQVDMIKYLGGVDCAVCGLTLADDEVRVLGLDEEIDYWTAER